MKVSIEKKEDVEKVEVVIICKEQNSYVDYLARKIEQLTFFICGKDEDKMKQLSIDSIYYFEAVDNKTYIYCKEKVYSSDMKLYELEENLKGTMFQRINKSAILNLEKMKSAKGQINGRMLLVLDNDEKIIVNRSYVQKVKECLRL